MGRILNKLKRVLHLCRRAVQIPILFTAYLKVSLQQILKKLPENNKTILFTLEDDRLFRDGDGSGRYAYMTLNIFSNGGYNVYLYKKMSFTKYWQLGKYGRLIYSVHNLKIIDTLPQNTENMIYAFDTYVKEAVMQKWVKKVYVNILKPAEYVMGKMVWISYYLHPLLYKYKQNEIVHMFRDNKRKIKIFFGGNLAEKYYSNKNLKTYFNQLTRIEGIRAVSELEGSVELYNDRNIFDTRLKSKNYINKCLILQTDHTFPIKPVNWLDYVSSADFFLCLSGTDLPMCHNAIESMAVGTIPIIGYPDWFFPPLEHRKNAILYSGKEDLNEKVKEVLAMSQEEIGGMRQNVIAYHQANLTDNSFIDRFEQDKGNINTIMLHPRINCTPKEIDEGSKVFSEIQKHRESYIK